MQQAITAATTRYFIGDMAIGKRLTYMLTFNLALIASAYIQFPLPFSPVPVTAQTMAVLACGLFLGPTAGALTVLAYLAEGAMGLPVFAGGTAGLARIFGPTGGYLAGFVLAAFAVGLLSEKVRSMTYPRLIAVLTIGTMMIFVPGLIVMSLFAPEGQLLTMGLYPFLPGAIVKIVVTASALSVYKRIRQSF
jgi:biotin transport system substrate-specific component